jgi:Cu/Ag efflux protein CusF
MIRLPKFFVGVLALALLLTLTTPILADEAKGTIRTANADKGEVALKGIFKDTNYVLNLDATVFLDGRKAKVEDLREGDRAAITYEKDGADLRASEVRGWRKATETTGNIHSLVADKQELVLKGLLKNTTYHLEKDGMVFINGKESNFSDLRPGDHVSITHEQRGDQLMAIEVRATRK